MPLIEKQHIVQAFGISRDEAIADLNSKLDALPIVRIVSMVSSSVPVTVMGNTVSTVALIAVVEEV
ncbi:hypothetical protein I6E74_06260 [Salinibacterium sp. SWN139]|uniref:hypothetical protein n=1 Tax=Salinibacterium sp. SWN139 TaxID=2792055 RepID=UPI0018CF3BDA|nr:hypothetical protein [Salinibacterium sp. SWN139]MBH0053774.1 hypothetical protein [Salinibacterium sp. SWN139]